MKNNISKYDYNKIEPLYIPEEMAEDKEMDEIIRQRLIRDADAEEEALKNNPALEGQMPSEEVFQNIVKQLKEEGLWGKDSSEDDDRTQEESHEEMILFSEEIQRMLSKEDQKALEIGRRMLQGERKRKWLKRIRAAATTAVIVVLGVFTISMGSDANREKAVAIWNSIVGGELQVNIADSEDSVRVLEDEKKAYEEIYQMLGIEPIIFLYKPEGFAYSSYICDSKLENAKVFYEYEGEIITVLLTKIKPEKNQNFTIDGRVQLSSVIRIDSSDEMVNLWRIDSPSEEDIYEVDFKHKGNYYSIQGRISDKELVEIIKNIQY